CDDRLLQRGRQLAAPDAPRARVVPGDRPEAARQVTEVRREPGVEDAALPAARGGREVDAGRAARDPPAGPRLDRRDAVGIEEDGLHVARELVARGPGDRPLRAEPLRVAQDLLHPARDARGPAEATEIPERIPEPIDVVDAEAVEPPAPHPAQDARV